jgi:hypothetical protein
MNAHDDRETVEFVKITRREMQELLGGAKDYLLELDGVKGGSRAGTHGTGGGHGAGKVSMRDFSFTMK